MQLRLPIYYLDRTKKNESILHPFGDDVTAAVPTGHERMGFQNAHGISRGPHPADEVFEASRKYHLGILGIAESNCAWDEDLKIRIKASMKQQFGNGVMSCASSKVRRHGYLPGGVMQLLHGQSAGRHVKSGADKYGRFTWMVLNGKNNNKLCVITAYRVCQAKGTTPNTPDSITAYWQQVQEMIKDRKVDPDPCNQVLTDLSKLMKE